MGEHRLRDLTRPERLFQVVAPGLELDFPPLRSLDVLASNLPFQTTSFVGRDDDLSAVAQAIGVSRLVTITGVGGVGKTRLTVQLAAEVLPEYAHGVWLCELASATDATGVAQIVARTLGVPARPGLALDESVVDYLGAKHLLLVLDNCEHVLDAAGALVAAVLRQTPHVRVLATSREALGIAGEQVWPLRTLAVPDASDGIERLSTNEAVRLFVERGRAANPSLEMGDAGLRATAEVCRRLDGIPLAIELAAARVAAMNPAEIAELLDQRFRLLSAGRRAAVDRHQTLLATVEWSYALLSPVEQLVFDRLCVFAGSFDAQAARAVVAGDGVDGFDVVTTLAGLVGKSMLEVDQTGSGATRYLLLETLREFGRERLGEQGAAARWRLAHALHFAQLAEEVGPGLFGPDELVWRRRLVQELPNMRAAVTWSLSGAPEADVQIGARIVAALAPETTLDRAAGVGYWARETLPWLEAATPEVRVGVLAAAAWDAVNHGELEEGERLARAVLDDDPSSGAEAYWLARAAVRVDLRAHRTSR